MISSADSQSRYPKSLSWHSSLAGVLLVGALFYFWVLPLFRPRGDFLWGYYRLKDVYVGIPIALAALCYVIVLVVPARYRRALSLRMITGATSLLLALALCDVVFAFGVMGVGRADFWLDQAHISRRYSIADPELGFARRPGISWRGYVPELNRIVEYHTDENGFRNPPGQRQADIVFIGDSFTEAAQVEDSDTFVRRVGRLTGLSVVNLARGAYGPQQELIVLQRYGLAYKPRVVVWQLFEGNDLIDAEQFAEWMKNPQQVDSSLRERYFANSLLNEVLAGTRLPERGESVATLRYHDGTTRRVPLRYRYEPDQPSTLPLGMSETLRVVETGQRLCESQGIQLLVMFVPTMVRVLAPDITFDRPEDRVRFLPEVRPGQKDLSDTMQEFCDRIGCSFVDGVDVLRRAATAGSEHNLYIPNDEHFDIGAHEVIAQVIVDSVRAKNLAGAKSQ
jgi:hypothetical protein